VTIERDGSYHRRSPTIDQYSRSCVASSSSKIVLRLPVRIRVSKEIAKENLLRAGMSVYALCKKNPSAS
jgi:hypothetical protein